MRTLALLAVLIPSAVRADDWPQWLGPQRDGVWRETGLVESFPAGGPPKVWSAKVGLGYAGPAVAGGKVYLTDRTVVAGQPPSKGVFDQSEQKGGERLFCLDQKTGRQLWEHSYPCNYRISYAAGPRCTPAVDGDRVYFLGAMGDILCLDADKGNVIWSKQLMKDYGANVPVWGFSSHPLIDGDKLIVLAGGSNGRLVIAFDKATGAEKWTALSYETGDWGYSPPVIYEFGGRRQLIVWHPKAVVGLDPDTGKKLWEAPFEVRFALTAPMPRKSGDHLFVTSFYNGSMLLKVGADRAEVVWKSKAKGERPDQTTDLSSIMPTPVVRDGVVYGVSSYGELTALELLTGKRLWQTMVATRGPLTPARVKDNPEPSTAQPWVERWANAFLVEAGDRTVLFNEQGELILAKLRPTGYDEVGRAQILKPTNRLAGRPVVWSHPAFADKCVFARNDEELVCVSLAK
jgi:outer membrane protein assembly factor BamB